MELFARLSPMTRIIYVLCVLIVTICFILVERKKALVLPPLRLSDKPPDYEDEFYYVNVSSSRKLLSRRFFLRTLAAIDAKPLQFRSLRSDGTFRHKVCSSCAIVFPSGTLVNSSRGLEIDGHECVIRTNDSPVSRHGVDVGFRTTYRITRFRGLRNTFLAPYEFYSLKRKPVAVFVLFGRTIGRRRRFADSFLGKKMIKNVQFFTINDPGRMAKLFYDLSGESAKNLLLTLGWPTFLLARQTCLRISVYGYVPTDFCTNQENSRVKYHYYGQSNRSLCAEFAWPYEAHRRHKYALEKEVMVAVSKFTHLPITFVF